MRTFAIQNAPRSKDLMILEVLRRLQDGEKQEDIAARFNTSRSYVSAMRRRVIEDDVALSGEPEREVGAGYGL